ncbi:MAG: hypothetical protein LBL08_02175 [Candidatus Nomurabacteria bacterium]|nr:hypothetical protein [Candidatus Nomurabacteria bacterium]
MEQESKLTMPPEKSKFKIVSIVFIVLTILLVAATTILTIQYFNQKSENANLQTDVEKVKTELSTYQAEQDAKANKTTAKKDTTKSDPNTVTAEELLAAVKAIGFEDRIINSPSEIQNSSVAPYQIVSAGTTSTSGVGGAVAMFYRDGVNGEWQYGFSTQAGPECDDGLFGERPILQKAFADTKCRYRNANGQDKYSTLKDFDSSMLY